MYVERVCDIMFYTFTQVYYYKDLSYYNMTFRKRCMVIRIYLCINILLVFFFNIVGIGYL